MPFRLATFAEKFPLASRATTVEDVLAVSACRPSSKSLLRFVTLTELWTSIGELIVVDDFRLLAGISDSVVKAFSSRSMVLPDSPYQGSALLLYWLASITSLTWVISLSDELIISDKEFWPGSFIEIFG
jgi:hypothetical protein